MKTSTALGLALLLILHSGITKSLNAQTLPSGIANLQLWLDGSDPNANATLPSDGTLISSWKDKSGNNRHTYLYTTGSGYTSPMFYNNQINGKGVIRLNGSGTNGSAFAAPLDIRAMTNRNVTMFTVYKQGTRVNNQAVWGCDNGGWDRFFFSTWSATPDNGSVSTGVVAPELVTVAGTGQLGIVKCLTAVYSKDAGVNGSAIYLNGQLVTNFTDNTTNGTDALADIRIGLDGDDNFFTGDIAEMIVYNRQLSACEITQVNRYLNLKYNVSFSTVTVSAGGTTTFPEGQSVTLNTSTTGSAYQWLKNDVAISGANASSYIANTSGNYRVAVTNSCIDTSSIIAVTATIPAVPGNALSFDGANDYIDAGTTILAPSIKTLECWAKFNDLATIQELVSKSKTGYGIELLVYNNALSFYCMNNTRASYIYYPVVNFVTGRWYHLVATWDGSTKESMKLFVDGKSVGVRTDISDINATGIADPGAGSKLLVGAWNDPARYFNGSIDEVRVWSVSRTEAQIRASAYDTLPRNTAGLLAYLRMDNGVANGTNTGLTTAKDYSSSNLTANLVNFNLTGSASNYVESYATVAPMVTAATGISATGFIANWASPVRGTVNNYLLDVSTNSDFSTLLPAYNNLNVGLVNTFSVTGLAPATTHYYRLRANKSTVNAQGANSYSFGTVIDFITLPVTWNSFSVGLQDNRSIINWSTATEQNSQYFTIERSADGINFIALGKVDASGSTQLTKQYNYTDQSPFTGLNYYRIRATDKDGKNTYTEIRSVNLVKSASKPKLYPSPASDHVYLDVTALSQKKGNAEIYNLQGQFVLNVQIDGGVTKINVSSLLPGLYLLKFNGEKPLKFEIK